MSRADLFIDPFLQRRPAAGMRLRAFYSVAGVFACGLIAYASWPPLLRAWNNNEFLGIEGVFTFPTWPMRGVVVLGSVMAALQYALLVWQDLRDSARLSVAQAARHGEHSA